MRRLVFLGALLGLMLLAAPRVMAQQGEQQSIVDRATLAVQDILGGENSGDRLSLLRRSRAVMVCPRLFRAGFIFGGEGGDCVLTARDGAGSWSSPAFYTMGSGSFGLQIGVQDAAVMMIILTDRGLNAVLDSQFKFGADASISLAHLGAGIEGSTTAAVGADIVTYARTRGLFAGLSLEGSLLTSQTAWNRGYYGREVGVRQIVVGMEVHNPGSDPLRGILIRFTQQAEGGVAAPALPPPSPGPTPAGGGYGAPGPAPGRVGRETLPPTPPRGR